MNIFFVKSMRLWWLTLGLHGNGTTLTQNHWINWLAYYIGLVINMGGRLKVSHLWHCTSFWMWPRLPLAGLSLHLCKLAQWCAPSFDLHDTDWLISSLSIYEHLHHVFHLCRVHVFHNIKACPVPEVTCNYMHSFVCIWHNNWDGTISEIIATGGKPGQGGLLMQINSYCTD